MRFWNFNKFLILFLALSFFVAAGPVSAEIPKPWISFSSEKLQQGDTLIIKIKKEAGLGQPSAEFLLSKIDFFKSEAGDWIGVVGVDAKKKTGKYALTINFPNGEKYEKKIGVVARKFPVTVLRVTKELKNQGYSPKNILGNMVSQEIPLLNKIFKNYLSTAYFAKPFIYPLSKVEIGGDFGNIRKDQGVGFQHLGVDLEAEMQTPVYAVNDGAVSFADGLPTYGKTMIIDHGLGIYSLYLHLSEFKFAKGDRVKRGDVIGLSGNSGYSISPHLHFSIKLNGAAVDPLIFIETSMVEMPMSR